jgi:YihY family inner membrane protein
MPEIPAARRSALAMPRLVLLESVRSFGANRNLESAATLAYYGFLSLMPLLLLAIFALGLVLRSSEQVMPALGAALSELFPTFNLELLAELQALAARKVWGVVSVVVLLWSMTPFAAAARSIILRTFKTEQRLHVVKAKLLDVAAILVLLTLFLALVLLKVLVPASAMARLGGPVLPFLLTLLALAFVYAVFAPVRLARVEWLAGAAVATVLLSAMRPAFGLLLQYNPDFGYAFGSLKAIFLLIVWVYYTFAVLLFGAEVVANTRRREALVLRRFLLDGPGARPVRPALLDRFVQRLEKDEQLFREGDEGHDLYVVLQGAISLRRGGRELAVIQVGDYFGEMSMLLDAPRSASAVAAEPDTQVIAVSGANFDVLLREHPTLVRRMLKEMAERLRATNEKVAAR